MIPRLLTFLIGMAPIVLSAQARLGSTAREIRNEYWDPKYQTESGYTDDGIYFVSLVLERATVMHLFNHEEVCIMSVVVPKNQGALNYYVENYNKLYVIISSTQWKMYSEHGIANIELAYPDNGGYGFIWTREE